MFSLKEIIILPQKIKQGKLCWIGHKVHLGFSVTPYGKTQTNFLANPIFCKIHIHINI